MHARTAKTYQVNLGTDPPSRIVCKAAPWQRNGTTMAIWLHRKKNGPTSWRDIWKYWVARRGVPIRESRPSKPRIWAWQILKSPFCVHPKTGRVCVPINIVDKLDEFDPFDGVPILPQLMEEELDWFVRGEEQGWWRGWAWAWDSEGVWVWVGND